MKKNRFFNIDYSMLSSYLGRSATVLVFSAIVLLAIGALYFEQDDTAHVPILMGICAFDSVRSCAALESLTDFVRERGGGDITLRFVGCGETSAGCEFLLMTSVQYFRARRLRNLECCCLGAVHPGQKYSRGALVVRPGIDSLAQACGRIICTSPESGAGYVSIVRALEQHMPSFPGEAGKLSFAGGELDYERVLFGVLFGEYDAGGISFDRYRYCLERGTIRDGELEVLLTGEPVPEYVLAVDPGVDSKKLSRFRTRLVEICDRMPDPLVHDLEQIGLAGFILPNRSDIDYLEAFGRKVP